jgi:DNA-binding transcriptional MocR family regulator
MTIKWKPKLQKGEHPLYQTIIDALAEDISSGLLSSCTRLPTHRKLAETLGIAIGTVTRAYAEAEKRGLVHGEGRRGTFVGESRKEWLRLTNPFEPASNLIDLTNYYPATGDDPDLPTALRQLARNSMTQWLLQYAQRGGLQRHREAGAKWIEKLGLKVSPESVIITSGAQHAIHLILSTVLNKGDVVLADSHSYIGVSAITRFLNVKLIGVPTDEEGMLPDALEATCTQRKVGAIYCNPTMHNPTAKTMTESRRKTVATIAEKYGFVIIEDEINRVLVPNPPPLLSSIAPERSYLIASVSKVVAAGLRACFVVCPQKSFNQLNDGVYSTLLMVSPLLLEVLTLWLKDGTVDNTIKKRMLEATHRQSIFREILGSHYKALTNSFGYFAWLLLPDDWSAQRFVAEARGRNVIISPGEDFVLDGCKPANAVRICLGANNSRDTLRRALVTLADILDNPSRSDSPTI